MALRDRLAVLLPRRAAEATVAPQQLPDVIGRFPSALTFEDIDPRNPYKPNVEPRGTPITGLGRKTLIPPHIGGPQPVIPHGVGVALAAPGAEHRAEHATEVLTRRSM
jgi:hypothetical protein